MGIRPNPASSFAPYASKEQTGSRHGIICEWHTQPVYKYSTNTTLAIPH
jgi:hypothetical protein